ncbi:MAG: amidase [Deltaproteobacteria bacterium]|jgi:amidase|nr:amidase [Deltaproteobacteria bacterium]MBW2533201.1 amidase [Deltaproteobacteria bacterium]
MSWEPMASWGAVETAARIRDGDTSAEEVIEAAIERAQAAMPLGAIVTTTFERARAEAAGRRGPLAAVPSFIKDLAQQRGVATGWGARGTGAYVSSRSDPFVVRFEGTGLISLGKSASPEFGLTATTEPMGRPPCRNPWAPDRSSGGSSGGAAALVAAGVVPLAHASDGGGSIRIPASCCGLVGLKPSRHRMDMVGSSLLPVNLAVDGCVTRSVRDTIAFFRAFEDGRASRRAPAIGPVADAPSRALRIGLFVDAPTGTAVHADHCEAARAAARLCESLGHHVEEVPCPFDALFVDDFFRYWGFVAWVQTRLAKVLVHPRFDGSKLEPWSRGIRRHFISKPWRGMQSIRRLRRFGRVYADALSHRDVLLCPTLAAPPPKLGYLATDRPFETAFQRVREYTPFTPVHNVAGAPAISLPLGRSAEGLPVGVLFAAAPGADRLLLELAASIEAAQPWPTLAPRELWATAGEPTAQPTKG